MHMTDRGLLALARHEGIVPAPYLDVKRVWTFGVGHTAAAGAPDPARLPRGMPADLDAGIREALRLFRADLARYEAEVLRAVTVPLGAARVRCAGVLPLQHRRDRPGGADKGSQCRRPGRRGRGVHELAPAGQPAPAPRGRARSLPARALPGGSDPGLGGRRRRSGRFLAAGAPAGARPRRWRCCGPRPPPSRRAQVASASRPAAGSPRCSLPFPPPSNGADPHALRASEILDLVGGPRRDPDRARRARSARARPARRARRGDRHADRRQRRGAGDADHPRPRAHRPARPAGARSSAAARSDEDAVGRAAGASRQRHDDARLVLADRARRRRRVRLHRSRPAARVRRTSPTSPSRASRRRRSAAAPTSRSTRRRPRAC